MKPAQGFALIIIIAIILLVFVVSVFIIRNMFGIRILPVNMPVISESSKPTPSTDVIVDDETVYPDSIGANWKTYTSTSLGFQIKYPQEWKVKDPSVDTEYSADRYYVGLASQLWMTDSVFPPPETDGISPISITRFETNECSVNPQGLNNYNVQTYSLGGKSAKVTTAVNSEFNRIIHQVNILENGYCYTASLHNTQEKYIKLFNQILSTFKFTN